ncbi:hypothetical protein COCNU_02G008320 [Cocos nucifera]|nr:hypothetical protein COCNU_02G008320 [Cocos nucifera]
MERCPSGGEKKSMWLMEEYCIHDLRRKAGSSAVGGSNKLDEWIICKIYLTPKARKAHTLQLPNDAVPQLNDVSGASIDGCSLIQYYASEEPSISSQDISDSFQIYRLAEDTLPYFDLAVPVLVETLIDVSEASIDGYSIQHASEEPSVPGQDTIDPFQIHQLADNTLRHSDPAVLVLVEMTTSLCTHPSQNIDGYCQILQLPHHALPQLSYFHGTPIDGCSPAQHTGEELSIPGQDIADSFQIHQLSDDTLPHSNPAVLVVGEMMEGPGHMSGQAGLNQNLKVIDAKDSSIAFFPEIMQAGDEETEEIAALLVSFNHDPSIPSIDDIL